MNPHHCWEWIPETGRHEWGYGMFTPYHGKRVTSHRFAYELTHGPIPAGMQINHKCNNPPCVNPDHLYAGTHQDNMDDAKLNGLIGRRKS